MSTDEPLEELELTQLTDEHVFWHRVIVCGSALSLTVVGYEPAVDDVECTEVLVGGRTGERVVVPAAILDDVRRCTHRRLAECGDALRSLIDHATYFTDMGVD